MEKWKIAAIVAIICAFLGYGFFSNSKGNPGVVNPGPVSPTPTASPYIGKSLPPWPNIKQWVNTPAPVDLSKLKGKPVILEVFRIQCSHCADAAPFLVMLNKRYGPRGLQFVGIQSPGDFKDPENPENNWATVQTWIKAKGYNWPVGFDAKSAWFQGKVKGTTYPSMYLLDSNGNLVYFKSGHTIESGIDLAVQIEKLVPGAGDVRTRGLDLMKWLDSILGFSGDEATRKSMQDDIISRLGEKIR